MQYPTRRKCKPSAKALANPKQPRTVVNADWDVEVLPCPTKGANCHGLFAKRPLPANARLIYEGVLIADPHIEEDVYIVASGRSGEWLDGNPKHAEHLAEATQWCASRVNEPSLGETANMIIMHERTPVIQPVFVTTRPIQMGEELLVHYGSSYRRIGYKVGKRADRPKWL